LARTRRAGEFGEEIRRTRTCLLLSIDHSRSDFGPAESDNQVTIHVIDFDGGGAGIAIPVRRKLKSSDELGFAGRGAVGVEGKELGGRRVASPAVVSPGSDSWSTQRLIIYARQGAALIKLLICQKSLEDDAVAIRYCDR